MKYPFIYLLFIVHIFGGHNAYTQGPKVKLIDSAQSEDFTLPTIPKPIDVLISWTFPDAQPHAKYSVQSPKKVLEGKIGLSFTIHSNSPLNQENIRLFKDNRFIGEKSSLAKKPTKRSEESPYPWTYNIERMVELSSEVIHKLHLEVKLKDSIFVSTDFFIQHTKEIKPTLFVITVGPDQPNLSYTDDDARGVAALYKTLNKKNPIYNEVKIFSLIGAEATRANLDGLLESFEDQPVSYGDQLIFHISTHGKLKSGIFFLNMSPPEKMQSMFEVEYPLFVLLGNLSSIKNLKGVKKFLFIDACRKGTDTAQERQLSKSMSDLISIYQQHENMNFLMSCKPYQSSYEDYAWKNGAFTYCMLQGLKGAADKNGDHSITLLELSSYLTETVNEEVQDKIKERNVEQNPDFLINPADRQRVIFYVN